MCLLFCSAHATHWPRTPSILANSILDHGMMLAAASNAVKSAALDSSPTADRAVDHAHFRHPAKSTTWYCNQRTSQTGIQYHM